MLAHPASEGEVCQDFDQSLVPLEACHDAEGYSSQQDRHSAVPEHTADHQHRTIAENFLVAGDA